jgi:ATP adenylyltransferase
LYLDLYARALRAVEQYNSEAVAPESRQPTMARISYNMAITDAALVLCPRLAEGGDISDRDGNIIGSVSLNGTILAGTILVKSEAEFHALSTNDDDILNHILSKIGVPNNQESR